MSDDYFGKKPQTTRDGATLEEIADLYGCTRERVRQIEANALRKLRHRLRMAGLSPKDLLPDNSITDKDY